MSKSKCCGAEIYIYSPKNGTCIDKCLNCGKPCTEQSEPADWEKEFDNTFDLNYGGGVLIHQAVKDFISTQIAEARKEGYDNGFNDGYERSLGSNR